MQDFNSGLFLKQIFNKFVQKLNSVHNLNETWSYYHLYKKVGIV